MRFTIRRKLLLAIGIPLVAAYAGTTWILATQLRARSRDRVERVAAERVQALAGQVEAVCERVDRAVGLASIVLGTRDVSVEVVAATLRATLDSEPAIARLRLRLGSDPEWALVRPGDGYEIAGPLKTYTAPFGGGDRPTGAILADVPYARLATPLAARATDELRIVLLARDGTVLWSSFDPEAVGRDVFRVARETGREDLDDLARGVRDHTTGLARAPGLLREEPVWFGYAPVASADASIVAALPEAVGLAFEREQIRIGLGILTAGLVVILAALFAAAAAITRPISGLARAVSDLGSGNLEAHVSGVTSRDEIGDLARGFDRMVSDLKGHVAAREREAAAREAALGELRVARNIQMALLPKKLPAGPGFSLHAKNLAARHVAGDFYDAFTEGGRVVFLVADVSGKGLPSALFMAVSRIVLRRVLSGAASLADAAREANDSLESEGIGSMYLTMFAASYDPATGSLRYVNAGHPLPWRVPAAGAPVTVGDVTGPPVGMLPGRTFEEKEETLAPGDRLVVFTDGVPEARLGEEFYGDERIAALLAAGPDGEGAAPLTERVLSAIEAFQSGDLADDVTVLVLGRA